MVMQITDTSKLKWVTVSTAVLEQYLSRQSHTKPTRNKWGIQTARGVKNIGTQNINIVIYGLTESEFTPFFHSM